MEPARPDDAGAEGSAAPVEQVCSPAAARCDGDHSIVCTADGAREQRWHCDPVQGMGCDAASGRCAGPCASALADRSYVGCEYFPFPADRSPDAYGPFGLDRRPVHYGVAVSNAGEVAANVVVEGGRLAGPVRFEVAPRAVHVEVLPWATEGLLSGSVLHGRGAYRLRSDQPVTVHQFHPLESDNNTTDASLLFPVASWGTEHRAVAWTQDTNQPGFIVIVASADDTAVTVTLTETVTATETVPEIAAGVPWTTTLQAGDVLELRTLELVRPLQDLTGSLIRASRPVEVLSGHSCASIRSACDYLEESVPPVTALGVEYLVAAPALPSGAGPSPREVRIVATADDTTLTFVPEVPGAETYLRAAGDSMTLSALSADLHVVASRRVLVAQVFSRPEPDLGDPSLTLVPPLAQFRREYVFHAPAAFSATYASVVGPLGAAVSIDGVAVALEPMAAPGFGVARVRLDAGAGVAHVASGDAAFGLDVYGYESDVSYWYPGGQDLEELPFI